MQHLVVWKIARLMKYWGNLVCQRQNCLNTKELSVGYDCCLLAYYQAAENDVGT